MRNINISSTCNRLAEIRPLFFGAVRGMWGRDWAHSIARQLVPIGALLTHVVYLLPFLNYLAGSKSVSVRLPILPYDPDTMTNTALEAIASSNGENDLLPFKNR